jgi:ppGpp synthetase/RelA/SpoT-type nucleotidyltranferase
MRFDLSVLTKQYSKVRPTYEGFAQSIATVLKQICPPEMVHTIEHRAKTIESFEKKACKTNTDMSYKYPKPLEQLTDFAGVRVIVFTRDAVTEIVKIIQEEGYSIREEEDVGDRVFQQGKFGYQSVHLLVELGDRRSLKENKPFVNLLCEIQVRTILQHAWAELEHDIQYKAGIQLPIDLKKRFSALAGLIDIADREFERILCDSLALKDAVQKSAIDDLTRTSLEESSNSGEDSERSIVTKSVRELMREKKYSEAITIYSKKISEEPYAATLYIGRAKAYFLLGDSAASEADLSKANELAPQFPGLSALRLAMSSGDATVIQPERKKAGDEPPDLTLAKQSITNGDGIGAFCSYSTLEASGWSPAFSKLGKASACLLENDTAGARNYLGDLEVRPATAMAISILSISFICALLDDEPLDEVWDQLEDAKKIYRNFIFEMSPISQLILGLRTKGSLDSKCMSGIDRLELLLAGSPDSETS